MKKITDYNDDKIFTSIIVDTNGNEEGLIMRVDYISVAGMQWTTKYTFAGNVYKYFVKGLYIVALIDASGTKKIENVKIDISGMTLALDTDIGSILVQQTLTLADSTTIDTIQERFIDFFIEESAGTFLKLKYLYRHSSTKHIFL